jgi:hypothetical protein
MADEINRPAAAPAATPASVDAAEAKAREAAAKHQEENSQKQADASAATTRSLDTRQAVAEQKAGAIAERKSGDPGRSSPLIVNPAPRVDPDAPVPVEDNTPSELPESTIAEMEAGKKALERNKPVRVDRDARADNAVVRK